MGNRRSDSWDKDDAYYRTMFEKFEATENADLVETPGSPDPLKIVQNANIPQDDNPYTKEMVQQATQDPTVNIEMFRVYVARLNRLI